MKFQVGDIVIRKDLSWRGLNGKAIVLGIRLEHGVMDLSFDEFNYNRPARFSNTYDQDFHCMSIIDFKHVFNGLQRAIIKAKE